ncbi:syntaxin-12 [Antrostomus carolinensis]|uniref:syntaxin-12 n=1 Tax=Antrostomus carolinensis TaxID=279965 RepID=UPI0010A98B28|nr:syntaxin-12 [Antrostomus carolinensis]
MFVSSLPSCASLCGTETLPCPWPEPGFPLALRRFSGRRDPKVVTLPCAGRLGAAAAAGGSEADELVLLTCLVISLSSAAQIKNLMSQLGTKQDSSKLQENLQQLQHSANRLAKETNEYLKELGSLPLPLSASEQRQQRLQKERLMNDFSAALNNFQAIQRRVSEKEKETVARARAGSRISMECGSTYTQRKSHTFFPSFSSGEDWNQMQSQEEDVAITEQDLELIKERETAIRQLEADILDVNQIFKDLAMMIHDQGDMIDSIEANVESAEVHVERASEQLQRAAYYQKKSRKKICILILGLAVASIIIGFIIWQMTK